MLEWCGAMVQRRRATMPINRGVKEKKRAFDLKGKIVSLTRSFRASRIGCKIA